MSLWYKNEVKLLYIRVAVIFCGVSLCGKWQTAMISLNAIVSGRKVKRRNVAMMPYAMM
jgi:hypothetical protein